MARGKLGWLLVGSLLWLAGTGTARADDDATLRWNPRWTRFTTAQYAFTGALAGGLFASTQWLEPASGAKWQSDILLDRDARALLGAEGEQSRRFASGVSDYFALGLALYPFVVDSLLVAGFAHGSYDVAYQTAMISLQSVMLTGLVTTLTKDLVGRARPDAGDCENGDELACGTQNQSFMSGHTSGAFTAAGLICAHHQNLALYGSGAADVAACGLSLGLASTVGVLRIVAGRHHLSDVLTGAAVGLASGYLLPNIVNYDFGVSRESHGTLAPIAGPGELGLNYTLRW